MIHNSLQNIIYMTLKQGNMVVLHNDKINNIHYKLGLNIYIYILLFTHLTVESIHVVEYFEKNILNDDTVAILESWLVTFL